MFTSRITKYREKLTYKDEMIIAQLLKLYDDGKKRDAVSSDEVARLAGCGQATVVRCSQKLGYPSYKSMMLDLIQETGNRGESRIEKGESIRMLIEKTRHQYEQSVTDVVRLNTDEKISEAVEMLNDADTIFCFGLRSSGAIASVLYYRLLETGYRVQFANELIKGMSYARNLRENDVLLVASVSGETPEMKKIVTAARRQSARIILITDNFDSSVAAEADVTLLGSEYKIHTGRFNLISRASSLFLIDVLFMRLWQLNENRLMEQSEEFSKDLGLYADSPDSFRL